jgi:hypothetical protein
MGHVFEPAPSGRSKCRGCGVAIPLREVRFGERLPSPYGEGEITLWFHPLCAACKRPEPFMQALGEPAAASIENREALLKAAQDSLAHRRVPRVDGAERAPSAKARCRSCRQPIERGAWRIRLTFYEEGRFSPGGFVHLTCRLAYFETEDLLDRMLRFSPALDDAARDDLRRACQGAPAGAAQLPSGPEGPASPRS